MRSQEAKRVPLQDEHAHPVNHVADAGAEVVEVEHGVEDEVGADVFEKAFHGGDGHFVVAGAVLFKVGEPFEGPVGEGLRVGDDGVDFRGGAVWVAEFVGALEEARDADADVVEGDVGVGFGGARGHGEPLGGVERGRSAHVVADAQLVVVRDGHKL